MDSAVAGLIGASIGTVIGLLSSLLSNWSITLRERERWRRDQQAEHERWLRERLQEIYSNSIQYLSLIVNKHSKQLDSTNSEAITEWANDFSEAQKWLGLLLAFYPSRSSSTYSHFKETVISFSKSDQPDLWIAKEIRDEIIDLASEDIRLLTQTE